MLDPLTPYEETKLVSTAGQIPSTMVYPLAGNEGRNQSTMRTLEEDYRWPRWTDSYQEPKVFRWEEVRDLVLRVHLRISDLT